MVCAKAHSLHPSPSQCFKERDDWFSAQRLLAFRLLCFKGIRVSPIIRILPL